jgi:hypothetical protein
MGQLVPPLQPGGPELHLRHGGEVLRGGDGARGDGDHAGGAALGAASEAHHPVLPAAVR